MTKIHAVIHHLNNQTTFQQAEIALAAGCDGVFLISHHGRDADLPELARDIQKLRAPDCVGRLRVGVNLLQAQPLAAVSLAAIYGLDMVWLDNAGVSGTGSSETGRVLSTHLRAMPLEQRPQLFAGVAFKYQDFEPNPSAAARNAASLGFVPTTSGSATGMAPTIDLIQTMSRAVNGRLAVASGMDVENVRTFASYLSHILVASGVSLNTYHFDPVLLTEFVRRAKLVPAPPTL